VTERYDMNQNNQLDSTEPTTVIATDLAGRRVATFITKGVFYAKETFFHHPPEISGPGFAGGPLVRDRNAALVDPDAWYDDADTDRLERRYYATDWQGRVVSMVTAAGELAESYRYTANGVPIGIPLGDVNGDGKVENGSGDEDWEQTLYNENVVPAYDARADLNLDGSNNATDTGLVATQTPGSMPTARASAPSVGNRMFASAMVEREAVLGREGDMRRLSLSLVRCVDQIGVGNDDPPKPPAKPPQKFACTLDLPADVDPCELVRTCKGFPKTGGTVVCVGPIPRSCVYYKSNGLPGQSSIEHCLDQHERDHFRDFDCSACPRGKVCLPVFASAEDENKSECRAYEVELKCLLEERFLCGSTVGCRNRINERIDEICSFTKTKYKCTPASCPKGVRSF
jgi:hypothetical protein